jgi:glycosyltransferase involved in cell wall biosynthesis
MRFSVDAHAIGRKLTGNEVYVRSLLSAFAAVDQSAEFIAYLSVDDANGAVPSRFQRRRVSANPFVRLGYELAARVRQDRPELLHVQYTAPLACPVPVVATVHDVSFLEHPEYFSASRALQLRATVGRTVASAARILTVSEFSRDAISRAYHMEPDRITVVPNAAASLYQPVAQHVAAARIRERFGLTNPFILTVGDLQPRKNQVGLIRAFAGMLRTFPQLPHDLVLAGKEHFHAFEVREAARRSGLAGRIHFTGFVPDQDLLQLYNACEFFVFPSFYEGFGLPVLEAMACGKAVACSSTSAVHEVADAAAILFDPNSVDDMARALIDLAVDAELRNRMSRLGAQRAAQFSWRRSAEQTLEVYYEVAREAQALPRRESVGTASFSR